MGPFWATTTAAGGGGGFLSDSGSRDVRLFMTGGVASRDLDLDFERLSFENRRLSLGDLDLLLRPRGGGGDLDLLERRPL